MKRRIRRQSRRDGRPEEGGPSDGRRGNPLGDANDGVINDAELRQRLIRVNETASLSRDQRIVNASRTALAAVTRDEQAYESLVTFLKLCVAVMAPK